ncbi:MAG: nicotinamide-nucleotide amidohydrolase family protein [Chitinivibrionales bacterium]|nr:nicotinamide-nucleotide amidohydrolase family protein [Chitinivibrionales bacterium]MBD3395578.1 nicotinamide-nucleotide amidohydrolase family protein [Chitinivibrionales bacterium]
MASKPGSDALEVRLGKLFLDKRLTLSVAESCTGGMIGAALTRVPGSSRYFRGGIIAYDNDVKISVLGVPAALLDHHGAVSPEVVRAMALGARNLLATDCAVAVSGIAGPGGGTPDKPAGLVYIGCAVHESVRVSREMFSGDRDAVRRDAAARALELLLASLGG